jgi:hypothetical protein
VKFLRQVEGQSGFIRVELERARRIRPDVSELPRVLLDEGVL